VLLDAEQSKSVCHSQTLRRQKAGPILVGVSVRVLADEFREDKIYYTSCKRMVAVVNFSATTRTYVSSLLTSPE
jgi:hypothetical protein